MDSLTVTAMEAASPHVLYLDLGSSLTKGVFSDRQGQPQVLLLGSEISGELTADQIAQYEQLNPQARPEEVAWIKRQEQLRAIGSMAKNFNGGARLEERKEKQAVDKILAAIGVMAERLAFKPAKF